MTELGAAFGGGAVMPALDVGTEPEHRPASAEVDDRPRHVGVACLVLADRVAVGQAEDLRDVLGVDEIVYEYAASHRYQLTGVRGTTILL